VNRIEAESIRDELSGRFGVSLDFRSGSTDGYPFLDLSPTELSSPNGFSIRIQTYWRRLTISFIPDNYARDLIREMGRASETNKVAFTAFASASIRENGKIIMRINSTEVPPVSPEKWPVEWKMLELSVERLGFDFDPNNFSLIRGSMIEWASRFLGMVVSLLPVEQASYEDVSEVAGLPEGAIVRVEVNRYERNRLNREACITVHGIACKVCGIRFDKKYGEIGAGFINVHHLTPLARMVEATIVDPVKDLVPVCPNCHAMLHREDPPLTIDRLKECLGRDSSKG